VHLSCAYASGCKVYVDVLMKLHALRICLDTTLRRMVGSGLQQLDYAGNSPRFPFTWKLGGIDRVWIWHTRQKSFYLHGIESRLYSTCHINNQFLRVQPIKLKLILCKRNILSAWPKCLDIIIIIISINVFSSSNFL
jgi:hypothetical protein